MNVTSPPHGWSFAKQLGFRFVLVFVPLFILTVPFPNSIVGWPGRMMGWEIDSDSSQMYMLAAVLAAVAMLGALLLPWRMIRKPGPVQLWAWLVVLVRYYLASHLLVYGFNKVFKAQFYLPEPNTLYTMLGDVPRDLLFWSTMGVSRAYCMVTGLLEVVAGGLILFQRTRLIGALLAVVALGNVVVINFCFDISVKLLSSFLLLLACLLVAPDAKRLWALLMGRAVAAAQAGGVRFETRQKHVRYLALKTFVVCVILFDALFVYFRDGNFNDDTYPRPPFHGAYAVTNGAWGWEKVFVHRRGYLIVQDTSGVMEDHLLQVDTAAHRWYVQHPMMVNELLESQDYEVIFQYAPLPHGLRLESIYGWDSMIVDLRPLDWRALPLLQQEFHWTSDNL